MQNLNDTDNQNKELDDRQIPNLLERNLKVLPKSMKAIVSDGSGGIELTQVDVPVAGPDQILVKVVTAGQNPADCADLAVSSPIFD